MAEMQMIAPNNMAMTNAVAIAPAINGPAAGSVQFPTTSLYVGDLDTNVTDSQVYETFSAVGQVVSVRVCRDVTSKRSLGYAYVNYSNANDAARAIEALNFAPLGNKSIRIMYSNRDPSLRRSGAANIFIKNLDKSIDNKSLHDTFSVFGTILSCKVATDASGQSKGYGFVQYETDEAAKKAIGQLNGMLLNDKQVFVGPFLRKQDRENTTDKTKFNNVFVKNLAESTTKEDIEEIFGKYGTITSAVVMTDENGKSRCFGFVNFENPDDAARAVQELNGKKFNDQEWYVGRAQKKAEREMELRAKFDQSAKEAADKLQGLNLYLKNLDDSISDDQLKEIFSDYGTITSCKVMKDQNGISKGSGFVAFSTTEEANRALAEMNGKMVSGKPLYVAVAQRKEDRRARLQAQFAQMQSMPMGPTMGPRMPMFPPGTPNLGQQVFYGQGPPLMAPQPGYGFQPQMVPGMRPGAPMPNFFVPFMQPGQQDPRPGGRRGGPAPLQQNQHAVPVMHNQMIQPRGRMIRYTGGRNMQDAPTPNMTGGLVSSYDIGSLPMRDSPISQSMPISTLASALANASPDQQRIMLGESLYPLVDQLEHENAAKVTGMLLEMDKTEVLHLLESPDALKAKVAEAMDVLHNVAPHQQSNPPIDQLGALSLGDGIVA